MSHSVFPLCCAPAIYVLPPAQASPEAVGVLPHVAGPEVEDVDPGIAAVSDVAVPEAEPEAAVSDVAASEAAVSEAAEPEVAFAARLPAADVSGPRASFDIALVFVVLLPVSVVVVEVDSPARPRSLAFPNVDQHASSSSSAGVGGRESARNSTCALANHGSCNILSNPGLHQNRNLVQC